MHIYHPRNVIICPCCYCVTGEILQPGGYNHPTEIRYHRTAAVPPDGNRCKKHARTEIERIAESTAALQAVWRRGDDWLAPAWRRGAR